MPTAGEELAEAIRALPNPRPREPLRRRLVVGSTYAFLTIALGQAFALGTSIVYARLLSPNDLGVLAVHAQVAALMVSVAAVGMGTPITRFVAQLRVANKEKLGRFLTTVFTIVIGATVAISISMIVLSDWIGDGVYGSSRLVPMIRVSGAFLILNSITGMGIAVLQGMQAIRKLSLVGIFLEALTIPVMFVSLTYLGLVGVVVGGVAIVLVACTLLFGAAWRAIRREGIAISLGFDRRSARELASFAGPLLASVVIMKLVFLYQTSFLALSLGYDDAGLFRVGSTVARIVAFVPAAMSVPLLPMITELHGTSSPGQMRDRLTTLIRMSAHLGAPIALAVGLSAGFLVEFLFGAAYRGASLLAFVLVTAGFLDMVIIVAYNSLLGEGQTRNLLALDLVQMAVLVIGTTVLVRSFGVLGAGLAAVANSVVYGVLVFILLGRRRQLDFNRAALALVLPSGGFAVAALAIVLADGQENLVLAGTILATYVLLSWRIMDRAERRMLVNAAREVLPGRRVR